MNRCLKIFEDELQIAYGEIMVGLGRAYSMHSLIKSVAENPPKSWSKEDKQAALRILDAFDKFCDRYESTKLIFREVQNACFESLPYECD